MAQFKLTAAEYAAMADMKPTDRQLYLDMQVYPRFYNAKLGMTRAALQSGADLYFQACYQAWRDDFIARPAMSYVPAQMAA